MTCVPRWAPQGFSTHFRLEAPQGSTAIELCLGGAHNVANALAACGRGRERRRARSSRSSPDWPRCARSPGRLQFKQSAAVPG